MGLGYQDKSTDELIEIIQDLEAENTRISEDCRTLKDDLDFWRGSRERLEVAADLMAEMGRIHNTPHANGLCGLHAARVRNFARKFKVNIPSTPTARAVFYMSIARGLEDESMWPIMERLQLENVVIA